MLHILIYLLYFYYFTSHQQLGGSKFNDGHSLVVVVDHDERIIGQSNATEKQDLFEMVYFRFITIDSKFKLIIRYYII